MDKTKKCNHKYPNGKTALVIVGGFIYEDLECENCHAKISELELISGPAGADPFGSYK